MGKICEKRLYHRTCGACKRWHRNCPGQEIRTQMCQQSHWKCPLMESVSGVLSCGVQKNLKILEGDEDNIMIS